MKDFFIHDATSRMGAQSVQSVFYVVQKQVRERSNGGGKFISLILSDRTGRIDAKIWDKVDELSAKFDQSDFVKVQFAVEEFKSKPQLKVANIRRLLADEVDLGDFQRKTEKDVEALWKQLRDYADSFADVDLKRLVFTFLDDPEIANRYKAAPAAKFMHHAWIGGLLEHVVDLLEFCEAAAGHFPLIHRDLLMTGAILHDIGKIHELSWEHGFEYTLEGQLVGHISIAARLLDEKVKTLPDFSKRLHTLVEHMILSHHGSLEFGSPKLPMIPEAVLLHYLDEIEAKMLAIREACQPGQAGADPPLYIDKVYALGRPLLNTREYLAEGKEQIDHAVPAED